MKKNDPAFFHKLYGIKEPRAIYYKHDFVDYALMLVLTALVAGVSYGFSHVMAIAAFVLCALMLFTFIMRHGVELKVPMILKRPQDVLYMLVYKLRNLRPLYFIALGLLLIENLVIAATPNLPHHVELTREVALYMFFVHFGAITIFRTRIMVAHLAKKELIREVLMQTAWKRTVNDRTGITLEIVHAYATGLLTHILLIAPWYLVIKYSNFSLIFLPIVCLANMVVQAKWLKDLNSWFYRDHWLAHNSAFEFVYLHGTHHDAIPSGMIAVAENGFLEGFLRFALGMPIPFYHPLISAVLFTVEIKNDMDLHQYIPGIYPKLPRVVMEIGQHSTHHYGPIEPYSLGIKLDLPVVSDKLRKRFSRLPDEIMNSIKLDEELTGFKWDNPTYRRTMSLYDQYHDV